jgi:hypothetical protein
MKLILSRKGFDSGAGGCPSPIFPDDSMLSLPIPDKTAPVHYEDLKWRGRRLSDIIAPLKGARPKPHHSVHLDPDLVSASQPRHPDWRPVLGQTGSSQGHLRNEGVGPGDLFLFFGLYRRVDEGGQFIRLEPRRHVIWGWLQVDAVIKVDQPSQDLAWVGQHPHIGREPDRSNTLYRTKERLSFPGMGSMELPGAGVFERYRPWLQLTDPEASGPSVWRLPSWFFPSGRVSALSYHSNPSRWQRLGDQVRLQSVGKGQEFVLNADHYPESIPWVLSLLSRNDS